MATGTTNEFNALCLLSPAQMLRLEILAFQGFSPVSNAFTQEADRLGLSPQGRERKEREERIKFATAMLASRQQVAEFQKYLDRLQEASARAVGETGEKARIASAELQRIRDAAFEAQFPDGTRRKVYRDGATVRDDAGGIVSSDVVRAADIPEGFSTWEQRKQGERSSREADREHIEAIEFHDRVVRTKERLRDGGLTADELQELQAGVGDMPASVHTQLQPDEAKGGPDARRAASVAKPKVDDTFATLVRPLRDFTAVAPGVSRALPEQRPDQDINLPLPNASTPAPR